MDQRLVSIERIRSFALILLIFLHSAVYHYSRIFAVIDDPPPLVAVMGLFVLFGGAFIMMSGLVNTRVALERFHSGERGPGRICLDLVITGVLILILHFVYDLLFGPASFDWDAETKAIALIPAWLGAEGSFDARRMFEGSSLSTIGTNLILIGILLRFLLSGKILERKLHYWILGLAALAVFSFAFFRYLYYPLAAEARARGEWGLALLLGILLEKPYPVLPYFSFALFGMILAFALREQRARAILSGLAALGFLVIIGGGVSYVITPPSLSSVTGSWFARVLIEAGFFLLVGSVSVLKIDLAPSGNSHVLSRRLGIFKNYSLKDRNLDENGSRAKPWSIPGGSLEGGFQGQSPGRHFGEGGVVGEETPFARNKRGFFPYKLSRRLGKADSAFRSFGAAALSIYFLETPLSELAAKAWDALTPGWRDGIGSVMAFAALNACLWIIILVLWRKTGYGFSLDGYFARLQTSLGRKTERTDLKVYEIK